MTAQEIWSKISEHQVEGVMLHFQLADLFNFLSLSNLGNDQERRFREESCSLRDTHNFAAMHHGILLMEGKAKSPDLLPTAWLKHTRDDVDKSTRRSHLNNAFERWHAWEVETKHLYSRMYKEAMDACLIDDACHIKELIMKVSDELAALECRYAKLKITDFDMSVAINL